MFQTSLEIALLANLLEKRERHRWVVNRNVARTQDCPACPGGVGGAQTDGEEAQRAARALEIRDGRPAFTHQVNQSGMERIGGADALAQFGTFLVGLLLLRSRLGISTAHLRDHLLIGGGGRRRVCCGGHLAQQAALDDP